MFDNLIILYRTLISYVNRPEFPLFIYFWCKIEIDCVALDEKEKCKKKKKDCKTSITTTTRIISILLGKKLTRFII